LIRHPVVEDAQFMRVRHVTLNDQRCGGLIQVSGVSDRNLISNFVANFIANFVGDFVQQFIRTLVQIPNGRSRLRSRLEQRRSPEGECFRGKIRPRVAARTLWHSRLAAMLDHQRCSFPPNRGSGGGIDLFQPRLQT
jgi:hypothetical protein